MEPFRTARAYLFGFILLAGGVGAAVPIPHGETVESDVTRSVFLDAVTIREQAIKLGSVTLPTFEGDILLTAVPTRAGPVEIISAGPVPVAQYATNVWKLSGPGGIGGTAIFRPDALKAIISTPAGTTQIRPSGEGTGQYVLFRDGSSSPPAEASESFDNFPAGAGEGDGASGSSGPTGETIDSLLYAPSSISGSTRTKTLTVYVDSQFAAAFGGSTWPDEVEFVVSEANRKFLEVGLQYSARSMGLDNGFSASNIDQAFVDLQSKSYGGNDVRAYMSYKDFSGCTIGLANQPGSTFLIQHRPDACHGSTTPNSDFEKVYLSKHEMGHNNNARHESAYSEWSGAHRHRSIMMSSAWYHYHDIWSTSNAARMCSYLATTCVGTAGAAEITHA